MITKVFFIKAFFNISEIKLSITLLFSVQIMSYFGASDIIYSNVIDSKAKIVKKPITNFSWDPKKF